MINWINNYTLNYPNFTDVNNIYLLYIAASCIFFTTLLIIAYMITIGVYLGKAPFNKDPLNKESLDYASIYSLNFMSGGSAFNYTYFFIIFLVIAFVALGCFLNFNKKTPENSEIFKLVYVALFSVFMAIILLACIFLLTAESINKVKKRTDELNRHICTNIFKKGEFLSKLKIPKKNTIDIDNTIKECLGLLKNVSDANQLAKGFYTLTLYNYFQTFSSKEIMNIDEAYKIFDLNYLLYNQKLCKPSGYMPRYGTFIYDIGETIIRKHMPLSKSVNEAMYRCDRMISITNELANTIYPAESYSSFIIMIVLLIVINGIMLGSIFYYGGLIKKKEKLTEPAQETAARLAADVHYPTGEEKEAAEERAQERAQETAQETEPEPAQETAPAPAPAPEPAPAPVAELAELAEAAAAQAEAVLKRTAAAPAQAEAEAEAVLKSQQHPAKPRARPPPIKRARATATPPFKRPKAEGNEQNIPPKEETPRAKI